MGADLATDPLQATGSILTIRSRSPELLLKGSTANGPSWFTIDFGKLGLYWVN